MTYDNTNKGTMGRNKRRETDKHPEFNGKANIDGQTYWISGWVREKDGEEFFSLSFKPAGERIGKPVEDTDKTVGRFKQSVKQHFPADDEIPF